MATSRLLFSLLLACWTSAAFAGDAASDAAALLEWKATWRRVPAIIANGSKSAGCKAWTAGSAPCNGWCGIGCDIVKRVSAISLENLTDFEGTLTPALTALDSLVNMRLVNLPGFFGDFTIITDMVLARLPGFLQFPSLAQLYEDVGQFPQLTLSGLPGLKGQWANGLARMAGITRFTLSNTLISGPLPTKAQLPPYALVNTYWSYYYHHAYLVSAPNFMTMDLSNNLFTGPLPDYNGTYFRSFSVRQNKISGLLPNAAQMPLVYESFDVSHNKMEGCLPKDWTNLRCAVFNDAGGAYPNIYVTSHEACPIVSVQGNERLFGTIPQPWAANNSDNTGTAVRIQALVAKPDTELCGQVPKLLLGQIRDASGSNLTDLGRCDNVPVMCPVAPPPPPPSPPTGKFCSSTFFSLPRVPHQGKSYLMAFPPSRPQRKAAANNFCLSKGFALAGTVKGGHLPKHFASQPGNWSTLNPAAPNAICSQPSCPAFYVIECVRPGYQPLKPDARKNIGCGNGSGSNNIGSWNRSGSNNRGSNNRGSNNKGDRNAGSNNFGHHNSRSNFFGSNNKPWV